MRRVNQSGGVHVDILREFAIYDTLPPWLKDLIQNADEDLHVEPIARLYVQMARSGTSTEYMRYEISKRLH